MEDEAKCFFLHLSELNGGGGDCKSFVSIVENVLVDGDFMNEFVMLKWLCACRCVRMRVTIRLECFMTGNGSRRFEGAD